MGREAKIATGMVVEGADGKLSVDLPPGFEADQWVVVRPLGPEGAAGIPRVLFDQVTVYVGVEGIRLVRGGPTQGCLEWEERAALVLNITGGNKPNVVVEKNRWGASGPIDLEHYANVAATVNAMFKEIFAATKQYPGHIQRLHLVDTGSGGVTAILGDEDDPNRVVQRWSIGNWWGLLWQLRDKLRGASDTSEVVKEQVVAFDGAEAEKRIVCAQCGWTHDDASWFEGDDAGRVFYSCPECEWQPGDLPTFEELRRLRRRERQFREEAREKGNKIRELKSLLKAAGLTPPDELPDEPCFSEMDVAEAMAFCRARCWKVSLRMIDECCALVASASSKSKLIAEVRVSPPDDLAALQALAADLWELEQDEGDA